MSYKSLSAIFNRFMMITGVGCFLEVLFTGIIGVIRGYSVEGHWGIFGLGCFICIGYCTFLPKYRSGILSYILFVMVMYSLVIGLPQGRYLEKGREYYEEGMYQEALEQFEKETQTWYLRLRLNLSEKEAMEMKAQTYIEIKDYDKARETYRLIIERYPGYYAQSAKDELDKLKTQVEDGTSRYNQDIMGKVLPHTVSSVAVL